jgi:hypothetical protein
MAASFIRSFQVSEGVIAGEATPGSDEELYTSPEELNELYGCQVTTQDIRAAMDVIHSHCNRASLWPVEYDSGILELPDDRQETRLPITPAIQITEAAGRYGQKRRDRMGWNSYQGNLAAYLTIAGGRPQWTQMDPALIEVDQATGIVFLPYSSTFLAPWAFVRFKYIAGLVTMPSRVKLCVFEIINEMHARGVGSRIQYGSGRIVRRYAQDGWITAQVRQYLEPYCIHSLF